MTTAAKKITSLALAALLTLAMVPVSAAATTQQAWGDEKTKPSTAKTYSIKYVLNGGKNNSNNPRTYSGKLTLKNPSKKGYSFKGWYTSKKFKKKVKAVSRKSLTLYAKWSKKTYKITYVLNKGKNSKKNPTKYTVTSKTFKLKSPTRSGYTFKGWYSDKKMTKRVASVKKGSTGNLKLYAKWEKKKTPWTSNDISDFSDYFLDAADEVEAATDDFDTATSYMYSERYSSMKVYLDSALWHMKECRSLLLKAQKISNKHLDFIGSNWVKLSVGVEDALAACDNLNAYSNVGDSAYSILTYGVNLGQQIVDTYDALRTASIPAKEALVMFY
ncbi:MAG: InlB B-repeat-containing protein [Adlercreutzia sp.]|nr:InlB B-repeat-containing protein [Adlercreutzia sp.]